MSRRLAAENANAARHDGFAFWVLVVGYGLWFAPVLNFRPRWSLRLASEG